jgi:hypothetical protein
MFFFRFKFNHPTSTNKATSIIGGDQNYPFHCMYSIISGTLATRAGFFFSFKCSVYIEDKDNYFTLTKLYMAQYLIFCLTILINGSIFNIFSYKINK